MIYRRPAYLIYFHPPHPGRKEAAVKKQIINLVLLLIAFAFSAAGAQASETPSAVKARLQEAYGKLPLYFEANQGQTDRQVKFLSRGAHHTLFLSSDEAVLVFTKPKTSAKDKPARVKPEKRKKARQAVLRMSFVGANPKTRAEGKEELPGKANYFIGNDPKKWRPNVPTYARVQYRDLYPGIDLIYYGNQRHLEYDFVVSPGADPNVIRLAFQGAEDVKIDGQGDLILQVSGGEVRLLTPNVYQNINGKKQSIAGRYILQAQRDDERLTNNVERNLLAVQVGFQVDAYDASRPLIIDPVLFYSTYLGGSGDEEGDSIAVDDSGNAYVTGFTYSTNFPTTPGAFQTTYGGGTDVFVTKLNPTGSGLVYSTYLGGNDYEEGLGIAVDATGNAYVTGDTASTNFPTTPGAFQTALGGGFDAFVTKLDPTGSMLLYSTHLGGSGGAQGFGIAVDAAGNAYVTGVTYGFDFPTTGGAFDTSFNGGSSDAFVAKLDPTGSTLLYSTYLGGSGDEAFVFGSIAVDAAGNAYVTSVTSSTNFPTTPGAYHTTFGGGFGDAFVTKLNPLGSALVYSTYLSGSDLDVGTGIALDTLPNPNAYVGGFSSSTDFPTTSNAFQTTFGGGGGFDVFVTKLNPTGSALVYSTYLGGSGGDYGGPIALDTLPNPNAYVVGTTRSTDFPTTPGAFQPAFGGGTFYGDAFVAKITEGPVPPGQTMERVTGGGTIDVVGGIGSFSFIVQRQASTGELGGHLQYFNHASGAQVQSETITSLMIVGNTATFGGTCTVNGAPCTFTVSVTDNGEPGTTDTFTISVDGGPTEGGPLRSGNILIAQ
jgi:hypothetical protein